MTLFVLTVLGLLIGLVAIAFVAGSLYPKGHVAERSLVLKAAPETVWEVISNFEDQPSWRSSLKKIERLPGEPPVWREFFGKEFMDLKTARLERPRSIIREIVGDNLPFSGLWEYALSETPEGGSRLTLIERGEVPNPIFRLIAANFMDPAANLELYLNDLAKKFGEPEAKPLK